MAVLTTHRFPEFSKWLTHIDQETAERMKNWLVAAISFVLGFTLLKTAIAALLMKLYEYFIQQNVLKL